MERGSAVPRPFEVSTPTSASVAEVHAAFGSEQYWRDRLEEYGAGSITLDLLNIDDQGTVLVKTIQDMRKDALPGFIAKVVPSDLKVFREETWRVVGERLDADVAMRTTGAPISGTGTAGVSPTGEGSLLRFSGTIQVRIPLIGGQIEKYISSQIVEEIPGVQRFTTRWIAENA
jgi:hypothetical protein